MRVDGGDAPLRTRGGYARGIGTARKNNAPLNSNAMLTLKAKLITQPPEGYDSIGSCQGLLFGGSGIAL